MSNIKISSLKSQRYEIRIAGAGGQGIILAGIILAEAGIIQDLYVAQSQKYGPETRGGNSVSEVILSDKEVDFPQSTELDVLIALTQLASDCNLPDMNHFREYETGFAGQRPVSLPSPGHRPGFQSINAPKGPTARPFATTNRVVTRESTKIIVNHERTGKATWT